MDENQREIEFEMHKLELLWEWVEHLDNGGRKPTKKYTNTLMGEYEAITNPGWDSDFNVTMNKT